MEKLEFGKGIILHPAESAGITLGTCESPPSGVGNRCGSGCATGGSWCGGGCLGFACV
ncbi:hypothetical protein CcarbDRAFT_4997 [Clostridium carboxidivorans P7]|uniref:Uncharacterized protein n=1 Tax=Clostridium carboxidivorans P7 TaxID=536227 RepID=C6Q1S9_9CLOT|nr:hypothetical protein [Clostridium carboxidivorans]EET84546.1 hypothetical protein CcarbDRAFT_4997 [Clostridium carboxidivorans P7]EFG89846.1 hypothetical protein CLCAR_0039 [Clostridium carboxidivorans P7]